MSGKIALEESAKNHLIVALDVQNSHEAYGLIELLEDEVGAFKVGMELRANEGLIFEEINQDYIDCHIFCDQKLIDIPNSVAGACRAFTYQGVWMLNVMAMGGKAMMEAAVEAVRKEAELSNRERPLVVAVTLLTSLDQDELSAELWVKGMTTREYVLHLAKLAQAAGLDGVVASPEDTKMIRRECGPDFIIVNPGIRPAGAKLNDQKRVGSPRQAILDGADYLVVGRPIIQAENPVEAAQKIIAEIDKALQAKARYSETALDIFDDQGIEFGAFQLKSHKRWPDAPPSPIFCNLRLQGSSLEHEGRLSLQTIDQIGELMVEHFGGLIASHDYIVGIPAAAEPIIDAIMYRLPLGAKTKRLRLCKIGTGEKRTIELSEDEVYPAGASVIIVDGLITKADSKLETAKVLRDTGMIVTDCLVVVDRQQGGPEEAAAARLTVRSIYTLDDLLQLYLEKELISAEQVEAVQTYKQRFEEYISTHSPVG